MSHGCPSPPTPNNPVGTPSASIPSPDGRPARPSGLFISHKAAIVFINGFGQGAGPDEGLYRLYRSACDRWYDRRRDLVLYRTWDSNHRKTAQLIKASGAKHVVLVGYSYGAGWGCTQMARHLAELGLVVHQLFLIDPVPRYRFIPAKIKSLTRGGVYVVPPTVRQVEVWQQVNKRGLFDPVGHEITWSKNTVVTGRTYIGSRQNLTLYAPPWNTVTKIQDPRVNHSNIDDDQAIHNAIINSITTQSPPPPPGPGSEHRPCAA